MYVLRHLYLGFYVLLLLPLGARAELPSLKMMILMPGPVIEAHADEERNCDACHGDFDKAAQKTLCLDCHEGIAENVLQKKGYHGISPQAANSSCKSCHKEHKGREYNPVPLDRDTFNHRHTNFELTGKHSGQACESCHEDGKSFREAANECVACHDNNDAHDGALGEDCGSCHSSAGWGASDPFDHAKTEFPLKGGHVDAACASCHGGQRYEFENTECISCHRVRDVHLGEYGDSCDRCHSEDSWQQPLFDHAKETDYELTGAHVDQPCRACHTSSLTEKPESSECVGCHSGSDTHAGRHGDSCDSCHQTSSWDKVRFDHAGESGWPLLGKHEPLSCIACHRGDLKDDISTQCQSCHASDSVHGANQLEDCGQCHSPAQWNKTSGFDHELTAFPLEGMHAVALCESCHLGHEFHTADSSCVACHEADDTHQGGLGERCEQCHSPNSWSLWRFDHDRQTDFELLGAHRDLTCSDCHGERPATETPTYCSGCHAEDDRHGGGFGDNCGRCHSNDSFEGVQWSR